jgi:4-hydroxy-tetrahydrodipicolinate reductase
LSLDTAIPLVTGVTGLGELSESWLAEYARRAPTFWAANFSVGVALLRRLSALAASSLGAGFDAELYELHHRHKLDAPSGTARVLAEAVCEGKRSAGEVDAHVSLTPTTPRDASAVQVSAGRGGGVFGDHTVLFLGESEQIELKHRALNRQVFASGALRAGTWLLGLSQAQEVGASPKERAVGRVYGMDDLWSV